MSGGYKRVLPLLTVGLGTVQALQQLPDGVPTAYLRLLVFDRDSNLVASKLRRGQLRNALSSVDDVPIALLVTHGMFSLRWQSECPSAR